MKPKTPKTRTDSKGQMELTSVDTPLYLACEELIMTKARVMSAKKEMEDAETTWCGHMKEIKKSKINHKGDIIQYVRGKTTEDHARFCKA